VAAFQTRDVSADPAVITLYEDGPYLIRGNFEVRDQNGDLIDLHRRTIALCRCGRSKLKPLCDGTHRPTRFRAPGTREPLSGSAAIDSTPAKQTTAVARDPEETLVAVAVAHLIVLNSLAKRRPEDQHNALRRAEPLLAAAKVLLRWQLDALDHPLDVPRANGHGLAAARTAVGVALKSAMRLSALRDTASADQVRSLLRDAASALRPAAQSSAPRDNP